MSDPKGTDAEFGLRVARRAARAASERAASALKGEILAHERLLLACDDEENAQSALEEAIRADEREKVRAEFLGAARAEARAGCAPPAPAWAYSTDIATALQDFRAPVLVEARRRELTGLIAAVQAWQLEQRRRDALDAAEAGAPSE